jgi:hypothetical protein
MSNSESLMLNCGTHGERASAVVCKHMLLNNPAPTGFIENCSDPDDLQAWCHQCEEKFDQEGGMTDVFRSFNDMALVCVDCYDDAKKRHSLPTN